MKADRSGSNSKRAAVVAAGLFLLAALIPARSAGAQPVSWAVQLGPGQVVPQTASTVGGFAVVTFNPETRLLSYSFTLFAVQADRVAGVSLRRGAAGTTGPVVAELSSGGQAQAAGAVTLSVADAADLTRGLLYIEVTTVDNPAGAARGQLVPPAHLPTPTSVPPTPTTVPPAQQTGQPAGFQITPPDTGSAGLTTSR
jgi:hypothetical protein